MASLVRPRPAAAANGEMQEFKRKKLKVSDLPITASQRSTMDDMVMMFTKKGEFDVLRKAVLAQFEESEEKETFIAALGELTEAELEKQPSLLSKDRRIAAALIEGAAERSDVYRKTESVIEDLVKKSLRNAEDVLRAFRRAEIGEDAALEEQRRDSKTEAEWTKEADDRQHGRLRIYLEEREKRLQEEIEEAKRKEEERRKKKEEEEAARKARLEEELKRREEREKERQEMIREREKERERERERDRDRERDRERELAQYERERSERRERDRQRREEDDSRSDRRKSSRRWSPERSAVPQTEQELEEAALKELLMEGERAAKERKRPEIEKDQGFELNRKPMAPKSIVPRDPVAARLATKLEKASSTGEPVIGTPSISATSDAKLGERVERQERARSRSVISDRRRSHRASRSPGHGFARRDDRSPQRTDIRRSSRFEDDRRESRLDDRRDSRYDDTRRSERYHSSATGRYENTRDREDAGRRQSRIETHDYDNDKSLHRPRLEGEERDVRKQRSRSPDHGQRDDRTLRRRSRTRSRSRSRDRRAKERARSQSRERSRRYRSRSESRRRRPAARSRSPAGIDRYVPGGGTARRERSRDRERPRDRQESERERSRDRDRTRDHDRDRHRERERDRDRDRDRDHRNVPRVPRFEASDTYTPGERAGAGPSARKERDYERRDRSRERGQHRRDRSRDREHERRDQSRDRNRERYRDRDDEKDRKKGSRASSKSGISYD